MKIPDKGIDKRTIEFKLAVLFCKSKIDINLMQDYFDKRKPKFEVFEKIVKEIININQ